jgi:hypothetical protein
MFVFLSRSGFRQMPATAAFKRMRQDYRKPGFVFPFFEKRLYRFST